MYSCAWQASHKQSTNCEATQRIIIWNMAIGDETPEYFMGISIRRFLNLVIFKRVMGSTFKKHYLPPDGEEIFHFIRIVDQRHKSAICFFPTNC